MHSTTFIILQGKVQGTDGSESLAKGREEFSSRELQQIKLKKGLKNSSKIQQEMW